MSKDPIEKGMFLRGGDYPARIAHTQKGMFLRGGEHPAHMLAIDRDSAPLDEIKIRLQRVQEALAFIRGEERRR